MNNILFPTILERYEDLLGDTLCESHRHPLKLVKFDKLEQINAQKLKDYAEMLSKSECRLYSHDVLFIFLVVLVHMD